MVETQKATEEIVRKNSMTLVVTVQKPALNLFCTQLDKENGKYNKASCYINIAFWKTSTDAVSNTIE